MAGRLEGDNGTAKAEQPSIEEGKYKLSKEAHKKAETLIDSKATPEAKLAAAKEMKKLGFPDFEIKDTDGHKKRVHISAEELSNGKTEIDVFAGKNVALRGINDGKNWEHELSNRTGKAVSYNGERLNRENDPAHRSALLGNEKPDHEKSPVKEKPADKPKVEPEKTEQKPYGESVTLVGKDKNHPELVTIARHASSPPFTLERHETKKADGKPDYFYTGSDGNSYKLKLDESKGTVKATQIEQPADGSSSPPKELGHTRTWQKNGYELEVKKTGEHREESIVRNEKGKLVADVAKENGKVISAEVPNPIGHAHQQLQLKDGKLTDGENTYAVSTRENGEIRYSKFNSKGLMTESTTVGTDGSIRRFGFENGKIISYDFRDSKGQIHHGDKNGYTRSSRAVSDPILRLPGRPIPQHHLIPRGPMVRH